MTGNAPNHSPSNVLIRNALLEDADAVTGLLARCYPQLMAQAYDAATLEAALPIMTKAQPKLLESGFFHIALGQNTDGPPTHGQPGTTPTRAAASVLACGGWSLTRPGRGLEGSGLDGSGPDAPDLGHLRHFAVDPAALRRGLARAIFEACRKQALQHGITRFETFSSLNAVPFYESLGLRPVQIVEVPLGPSAAAFPSMVMVGTIAER